jgi:hypothetical protein
MRKKLLFIFAVIAPFLFYSIAGAQTLVVKLKNGTENELVLSTVQKITFSEGSMVITSKTGNSDSYPLSDVQKILFSLLTGIKDIGNDAGNSISIYPNPVQDVLFVNGVAENTNINIFNTNGVLLQTTIAKEKTVQLNVGTLPPDIYLLQSGNQTVKFIKSK